MTSRHSQPLEDRQISPNIAQASSWCVNRLKFLLTSGETYMRAVVRSAPKPAVVPVVPKVTQPAPKSVEPAVPKASPHPSHATSVLKPKPSEQATAKPSAPASIAPKAKVTPLVLYPPAVPRTLSTTPASTTPRASLVTLGGLASAPQASGPAKALPATAMVQAACMGIVNPLKEIEASFAAGGAGAADEGETSRSFSHPGLL